MLITPPSHEHWRLLTRANITLRKVMPWGASVQKTLWRAQPAPFTHQNLMIASDYGGEHKAAGHLIYAFLIADGSASGWAAAMRDIRKTAMTEGRRMSFKRLDDPARQQALVPYLEAADTLTGHLVVVAVDKRIKWLVTRRDELHRWRQALNLRARWTDQAFENMARKAYLVALCLSIWSRPMMNVAWITDQDQAVANDARLDDAHRFAATMASLHLPHRMGEFAMNSTAIDGPDRTFEDVCAIPDLAAGMAADVCAVLMGQGGWAETRRHELEAGELSPKAGLIADWFGYSGSTLRKTMIQMDHLPTGYSVRRVWQP